MGSDKTKSAPIFQNRPAPKQSVDRKQQSTLTGEKIGTVSMIAVKSTNVKSIGYNKDEQKLLVKFTNDNIYVYNKVPIQLYLKITKVDSVGRFINQHIKGRYEGELYTPANNKNNEQQSGTEQQNKVEIQTEEPIQQKKTGIYGGGE